MRPRRLRRAAAASALAAALALGLGIAAAGCALLASRPAPATSVVGPYAATLRLDPPEPVAGEPVRLTYSITDVGTGAPVSDLQVIHERILHTFLTSEDLAYVVHVHHEDFAPVSAEDLARATFTYPHTFPFPGRYLATIELTHRDRSWITRFPIEVGGEGRSPGPIRPPVREAAADGYRLRLRTSPDPPVARHPTELVLRVETRAGEPVTDLGRYLGSEAHVAFWRQDGAHFGHQHAFTPAMAAMGDEMAELADDPGAWMAMMAMHAEGPQVYFGPEVPVRHEFPEAGDYRVFAEVVAGGEVRRGNFAIRVVEPAPGVETELETIVPPGDEQAEQAEHAEPLEEGEE